MKASVVIASPASRHRRPSSRKPRVLVTGGLGVITAIAVALGYQSREPSPPTATTRVSTSTAPSPGPPSTVASTVDSLRRGPPVALGEADGAVPDGATVFDGAVPGVAKLDPALLGALRRAATDAARNGVEFHVESGWRSPAYQEQLLNEAVVKYGSEAEAARWVAPPNKSAHVSGDAVDIGTPDAIVWLSRHGAAYGLCQIYGNEPWHYELRPKAIGHGCPAMYADPTHDPRMQR